MLLSLQNYSGWKAMIRYLSPRELGPDASNEEALKLILDDDSMTFQKFTQEQQKEYGNKVKTNGLKNDSYDELRNRILSSMDDLSDIKRTIYQEYLSATSYFKESIYGQIEDGAPVTIKYEDEEGNAISNSDTLNGKIGQPYETQAKTISEWILKMSPANAKGTFTSEAQEVVYIYEHPVTIDPGPGDNSWIKVQIPTDFIYSSTSSSGHKIIDSPDYLISNLSQYPVSVSVDDFTGGIAGEVNTEFQTTLDLVAGSKTVSLIKTGGAADVISTELFKLKGKVQDGNVDVSGPASWKTEDSFKFTGLTDSSISLRTEQKTVENKLHFTFKALDAEGN